MNKDLKYDRNDSWSKAFTENPEVDSSPDVVNRKGPLSSFGCSSHDAALAYLSQMERALVLKTVQSLC
jgi:hypothetical protein